MVGMEIIWQDWREWEWISLNWLEFDFVALLNWMILIFCARSIGGAIEKYLMLY